MKMHLCTCEIAIGGDTRNTVVRGAHDPVSFPEIQILRYVHGAEAVMDVKPCATTDTDNVREKNRLAGIYGAVVEQAYPGFAPTLPLLVPGVPEDLDAKPASKSKAKAAVAEPAAEPTEQTGSADEL